MSDFPTALRLFAEQQACTLCLGNRWLGSRHPISTDRPAIASVNANQACRACNGTGMRAVQNA